MDDRAFASAAPFSRKETRTDDPPRAPFSEKGKADNTEKNATTRMGTGVVAGRAPGIIRLTRKINRARGLRAPQGCNAALPQTPVPISRLQTSSSWSSER